MKSKDKISLKLKKIKILVETHKVKTYEKGFLPIKLKEIKELRY